MNRRKRTVAFAYRGNLNPPGRSIDYEIFKKVFENQDITFVSLQRELSVDEYHKLTSWPNVIDATPNLVSFDDTAALLSSVDMVLTIDTGVAHLAGALGRPTWLMVKYGPDWRWLQKRTDSPWYSSMRLFRQPATEIWPETIDEVAAELNAWASQD